MHSLSMTVHESLHLAKVLALDTTHRLKRLAGDLRQRRDKLNLDVGRVMHVAEHQREQLHSADNKETKALRIGAKMMNGSVPWSWQAGFDTSQCRQLELNLAH